MLKTRFFSEAPKRVPSPVLRLMLILLCLAGTAIQGSAMGFAQHTQTTEDLRIPGNWGSVRGFAARDDGTALEPGFLRVYRTRLPGSPAQGLPASVRRQAEAVAPLAGLPAAEDLSNQAAAAQRLGVDLRALAEMRFGSGKYTLPNALLAVQAGTALPGFFHAYIAPDQPGAPVTATLYCLAAGADGATVVSLTHLGQVPPGRMRAIKQTVCGNERRSVPTP